MGNGGAFMSLVERAPYDKDKLIGQAVSWFLSRQSPNQVEFVKYENGYQVHVYCDGDEAEEAQNFWKENIQPHLGGDQ